MMTIYGDVWKDAADREANPNEPVLSRIAFFATDDKAKEEALKVAYAFAEFFPELAGGTPIIDAESVTLGQTELPLLVGKKQKLTATVSPEVAKNKDVVWKSSDETIATVIDGKVEAVAAGEATITVKTVDRSKTATCKVTVV
jgi:acetylornithine/succinyldiaminopimelate/putrescine aminotransferase